jgi:2-amino-4-hydroxy-6-hydroxymethyldihydropteridine diphosphokinase
MRAFVGIGSNLGEREELVRQALEELAKLPDTTLVRASSLYDTEPVGEIEQPRFLNAAVMLDTELTARQLLWNLQRIEARLGRVRSQRWGPRTMDLDLLLYGDLVIEEPELHLPHPELARRAFVLVPLVELDPGLRHPVSGLTVVQMLARLEHKSPVKRISRLRTRG